MISILVMTAALAAPLPKFLEDQGVSQLLPVTQGSLTEWVNQPACLRPQGERLPTMGACPPSLQALFSMRQCEDRQSRYLCPPVVADRQALSSVWGIQSVDLDPLGGRGVAYFAIEQAIYTQLAYSLVSETKAIDASDAVLGDMVEACQSAPQARVVVEVFLGCGKLDHLERHDPTGKPVRIKDGFMSRASRGDGQFITDLEGAEETTCAPDNTRIVAMKTATIDTVCASAVFPEALRRRDSLIDAARDAAARRSPDERRLPGILAAVRERGVHLNNTMQNIDAILADGWATASASRELLEGVDGRTDQLWVSMLTEVGHIEAELQESSAEVGKIKGRIPLIEREGLALLEKVELGMVDTVAVKQILADIEILEQDTLRVADVFRSLTARVRLAARSADFVHGWLAGTTNARDAALPNATEN
jgi:hypothetical protein